MSVELYHPDMNTEEGHLGGYIRGRQSRVPTVYQYQHGDPATWSTKLWEWAYQRGLLFRRPSGSGTS